MDGLWKTPIKMDNLGVPLFSETSSWWKFMVKFSNLLSPMFMKHPELRQPGEVLHEDDSMGLVSEDLKIRRRTRCFKGNLG